MSVIASCPSCDYQKNVNDSLLNKKVKCPKCSTVFVVAKTTSIKDFTADKRQERRVQAHDLTLYIGVAGEFDVKDFNTTGVGFEDNESDWDFYAGKKMFFDVYEGASLVLKRVRAEVKRYSNGTIGCVLTDISHTQVSIINDLIERQQFKGARNAKQGELTFTNTTDDLEFKGAKDIKLVLHDD